MAYIISNSNFTPFTYEEKIKPFMEYQEDYSKTESAYTDLMFKADQIEAFLNEEKDSKSYNKYLNLYNRIQQEAEALASEGLTSDRKASIYALYKDYSKNMLPVARAIDIYNELWKERRADERDDETVIYERPDLSIDDIVDNPNIDFGGRLSGNALMNTVYKLSKEYSGVDRGVSNWYPILGGQAYERTHQIGYTQEEINDVMTGKDTTSPLAVMFNDIIKDTGVLNWESLTDANGELTDSGLQTVNKLWDVVGRGLAGAIGKTEREHIANRAYAASGPAKPPKKNSWKMHATTHTAFDKEQKSVSRLFNDGVLQTNALGGIVYNPSYIPTNKIDGAIPTPIDVYNEYVSSFEKYKKKQGPIIGGVPQMVPVDVEGTDERNRKMVEELKAKYGVENILTEEQYKDLLPISENFSGHSFSYTQVSLSAAAKSYNDGINYKRNAKDLLANAIINGSDSFKNNTVYKLDKDGNLKVQKDSKDVIGEDAEITNIYYDAARPEYVKIQVHKGDKYTFYYVDPSAINQSLANLMSVFTEACKSGSEDDQDEAFYALAEVIAEVLNPKDEN